jgi:hypothetical protein
MGYCVILMVTGGLAFVALEAEQGQATHSGQ